LFPGKKLNTFDDIPQRLPWNQHIATPPFLKKGSVFYVFMSCFSYCSLNNTTIRKMPRCLLLAQVQRWKR